MASILIFFCVIQILALLAPFKVKYSFDFGAYSKNEVRSANLNTTKEC